MFFFYIFVNFLINVRTFSNSFRIKNFTFFKKKDSIRLNFYRWNYVQVEILMFFISTHEQKFVSSSKTKKNIWIPAVLAIYFIIHKSKLWPIWSFRNTSWDTCISSNRLKDQCLSHIFFFLYIYFVRHICLSYSVFFCSSLFSLCLTSLDFFSSIFPFRLFAVIR